MIFVAGCAHPTGNTALFGTKSHIPCGNLFQSPAICLNFTHKRNIPPHTADELWRVAKVCRVANVMRPYLKALGQALP